MIQYALGQERVSLPAGCFGDVVLRQSVNQVHVGADQFADAGDALHHVIAVIDEEFQVQGGYGFAGGALAGRAAARGFHPIAEYHVGGFQQFQQRLAARQFGFGGIGEDRIPFLLGDREEDAEPADDGFQQFGQNLVRVVKFDLGEIGSEARNIRQNEIAVLGFCFQPLSLFNQNAGNIFMQNAGDQGLIGYSLLPRPLLQTDQIFR